MASHENPRGKMEVPLTRRDILFLKARYLLNQRHFKRPWFKLNPFLERTDDNIDLESFVPDESKFVQHLESLVLCESLHAEFPLETREISIENFFPYLKSDAWSKGCSIRVLDGQLLDEILIGLYHLEKQGIAVHHSTHAFANNSRRRNPCYKNTITKDHGSIEETLHLQFTHFGRLTKDKPNPCTLDPFEYIHRGIFEIDKKDEIMTGSPWDLHETSDLPSILESKSFDPNDRLSASPSFKTSEPCKWGLGSLISKHMNAISFIQAIRKDNSKLKQESKLHPGVFPQTKQEQRRIPHLTGSQLESRRRLTQPSFKTLAGSDKKEDKDKPQKKEETKLLISTKRKSSLTPTDSITRKLSLTPADSLDFDVDTFCDNIELDSEIDNEEEDNIEFFGEEFYLSDVKRYKKYSVHNKLQQKKRELQERRKEIKQRQRVVEEQEKLCNRVYFPKVEIQLSGSPHIGHQTIYMPDHVPTFEEFLEILKTDECYDPRYRNTMRLKSRKIAERYYLARGQQRPSVIYSPDEIEFTGMKKRKSVSIQNKKIKTIHSRESNGNIIDKPQFADDSQGDKSKKITQEHANQVLAVTDSHPCKDHYIKKKGGQLQNSSSVGEVIDVGFDKVEDVGIDKVKDVGVDKVEGVGLDKDKGAGFTKVKGAGLNKVKSAGFDKAKGAGLDKVKSAGFDKVKGAGLDKVKSSGFDKVKGAVFDTVEDVGFDRVKSADLDKVKSAGFAKVKGAGLEKVTGAGFHKIKGVEKSKSPVSNTQPPPETRKDSLFPKITLCDEESDISDTESEESSEEEPDVPELFDPTKLNTNYSIERIRRKKRSKAKKKPPAFIEILAKYYNMQNVGRSSRSDSSKEDKKSPEPVKTPGGMLKQMFKKKKKEPKPEGPKMVIGQLRKFKFLDTKPEKRINLVTLSPFDFAFTDRDKFHQLLIEAIDQYVVRREIVVSSRNTFHNAHTSVTFTKISCFQHKNNSCH